MALVAVGVREAMGGVVLFYEVGDDGARLPESEVGVGVFDGGTRPSGLTLMKEAFVTSSKRKELMV